MTFRKRNSLGQYLKTNANLRFWKFVNKTESCWNWIGSLMNKYPNLEYGSFYFNGKCRRSHRVSWILHFGKIPKGMLVCHKCDNTLCVRPDHLFLGSYTDNARDAIKKGRGNFFKAKTSCIRGHKFSKEHIRIYHWRGNENFKAKTYKVCVLCENIRNKKRSKNVVQKTG